MMTRSHPYHHLEKKKIKVGKEQVQKACSSEELDLFEELKGKALGWSWRDMKSRILAVG